MNSRFSLRPAAPADVPGIVDLMRQLAEYEGLTDVFAATHASLHAALFGPAPMAECLVAVQTSPSPADGGSDGDPGTAFANGGLLAYALWFQNYSTFLCKPGLYLEDVYVRADARQQGIGRALLQRLAQIAVQQGCGRFEWTVLDWNQPAIGFYQALGAEVLPQWRIVRMTGDALAQFGGQHG